jgi:hypothetical protein
VLKKRIGSLEKTNELLRKDNIELNSLSKKQKQIEKKVSNTIDQYNKLKKNNEENLTPQTVESPQYSTSTENVIPNISTHNIFSPLNEENPNHDISINISQSLQDETKKASPKTLDAVTVILCDLNGRKLNPKLLCPNSSTEYLKCPTLESANQLINQYEFKQTKTFIVHVGTNDIEKFPINKVTNQTRSLLTSIGNKNPEARILLSNLLPRSDELLQKAQNLNRNFLQIPTEFKNVTNIEHTNLYDKKHLNDKGIKIFAKNLKSAFFGTQKTHRHMKTKPLFHPDPNKPFLPNPLLHSNQGRIQRFC